MARAIVAALTLLSVTVQSARAADSDTPDVSDRVVEVANDTGKDPVELAGAVNSTSVAMGAPVDPLDYLYGIGEAERPPAAAPLAVQTRAVPVSSAAPTVASPPVGVWDRLAQCEAGGNWASTSNPRYSGGLQMDSTFWSRYGGLAYASTPARATRAQQITVAQRGQAVQGWGAWPVCSRVVGLR